jgi:hypothetical protein
VSFIFGFISILREWVKEVNLVMSRFSRERGRCADVAVGVLVGSRKVKSSVCLSTSTKTVNSAMCSYIERVTAFIIHAMLGDWSNYFLYCFNPHSAVVALWHHIIVSFMVLTLKDFIGTWISWKKCSSERLNGVKSVFDRWMSDI